MKRRNKIILGAAAGGLIYAGAPYLMRKIDDHPQGEALSKSEQSSKPQERTFDPLESTASKIAVIAIGALSGASAAAVFTESDKKNRSVAGEPPSVSLPPSLSAG